MKGVMRSPAIAAPLARPMSPPAATPAATTAAGLQPRWISGLRIKCRDADQRLSELSGGTQQKIAFARLLEHPARIFILDEPTRGIDVGSKAQLYQLIGELAAAGKAVLLVSSYLPELLGLCDTIGVMCRGELAAVRARAEWTEPEIMRVATGSGPSCG